MKEFLNPGGKRPPGYTQVVTSTGPGKLVFLSGQGGADENGVLAADFTAQCENTFRNLGRCLEAAGARFSDIVKINYYVTDLGCVAELREIRAKYLNQEAPPASTLVESGLIGGLLVEIEAVAVVPE